MQGVKNENTEQQWTDKWTDKQADRYSNTYEAVGSQFNFITCLFSLSATIEITSIFIIVIIPIL